MEQATTELPFTDLALSDMTIFAIIFGAAGLFLLWAFIRIFLPDPKIFRPQRRDPMFTVDTQLGYHGAGFSRSDNGCDGGADGGGD